MLKKIFSQLSFYLLCSFLILSQIRCFFASEFYAERLEIYPLRSSSFAQKVLWHFSFEFQSIFDPDSHITQEAIPPRPVLENIFVYSNTTNLRIELANGKPNPFLLEEGTFYFSLPKEGKIIFTDQYALWKNLMFQIQEVFSLSVQHLADSNNYIYNLDINPTNVDLLMKREKFPNYEKYFRYGSDPVDFICNDLIEKIQTLSPCRGSKGLFKLIKVPDVFGSDYVSSSVSLHYDRETKKSYFKVEFNIIGHPNLLDTASSNECKGFHSSEIIDHRPLRNSATQTNYKLYNEEFSIFKMESLPNNVFEKMFLKSQRYLMNPRFNFESAIVHELVNSHSNYHIEGVCYEYLPGFVHPIFHKITLLVNNTLELSVKDSLEIEYSRSNYALLRFKFRIPPNSILKIKIPFEKLIKSFERYPHDPARGQDIIPAIVFYRLISSSPSSTHNQNISRLVSNDILVEIPHSDLSMPFTNIAIVMAMIGFVSMSIYRALFENPKKISESILKSFTGKIKERCLRKLKPKVD